MAEPPSCSSYLAPLSTSGGLSCRRTGFGPDLVLLHGGAGSWTHWIRNIPALSVRFTVTALDLPGYGRSSAPDKDTPLGAYLDLVLAALDELCPGSSATAALDFAGFSYGGYIATELAARLGPRARRLSIIGPSGFEAPVGRNLALESERRLAVRLGRPPSPAEVRELHRANLAALMIHDPRLIDETSVDLQADNVRNTRFDSRRLSWAGRMAPALAAVTCPVQLIYGAEDRSAYPSVAHRIGICRAARPDIRTRVLEGVGHWAQYEAPAAVDRLLLDFHDHPGVSA